ncbi:MAG: hypothetical protein IPL28_25340 [Chloroflexi bacterium]|nr:hypothetical protein [Chloroflexota bacterium]
MSIYIDLVKALLKTAANMPPNTSRRGEKAAHDLNAKHNTLSRRLLALRTAQTQGEEARKVRYRFPCNCFRAFSPLQKRLGHMETAVPPTPTMYRYATNPHSQLTIHHSPFTILPPDPPQMFHDHVGGGGNMGEWHGQQGYMVFVQVTAVPPTPTTLFYHETLFTIHYSQFTIHNFSSPNHFRTFPPLR